MKAYIIVRGGTFEDLQEKVEELVTEGYTPVGSPNIMMSSYVQAVYLKGIADMFDRAAQISIVSRGPAVIPTEQEQAVNSG